jgi:hypothetical protein
MQAHGFKQAIKEAGEGGGAAAPAPAQGGAAPALHEEVKRLKSPRRKVARQPVVPLCAPKVDFQDASFSAKMLYKDWQSLGKLSIHLGVQRPTDPLQTTVMDYAFKVNVLAGQLASTTMTTMMAA